MLKRWLAYQKNNPLAALSPYLVQAANPADAAVMVMAVDLADSFCCDARKRVEQSFNDSHNNNDRANLKIAKQILGREFEWMENQIIK